jgi:signal transduction histidine kinase
MSVIKSGTAILNHTIKNELDKINYIEHRIRACLQTGSMERIEELLDHMPKVTGHLQQMVQRIQDKTGDIKLVKTSQSLHVIIDAVVLQLAPHLELRLMERVVARDQDVVIHADPVHLQEALFNLCLNAVDAMKQGQGVLMLRVHANKRGARIEIEDNGCGIPKELQAKVFEPFYSTKKSTHHCGLGLSYALTVVRKHSGTLRIVRSEEGKGTVIAVFLPRTADSGSL